VTAVAKHGVNIRSSGISTTHNEGIAARAGSACGVSLKVLANNVTNGTALGALFGAGLAAVTGYQEYRQGNLTWDEVVGAVVREGVIGGAAGGLAALGGTLATVVAPSGKPALLVSVIVGLLIGIMVSKYLNAQWDDRGRPPSCRGVR
jgi:hypothetical protein